MQINPVILLSSFIWDFNEASTAYWLINQSSQIDTSEKGGGIYFIPKTNGYSKWSTWSLV
jgi:hypothetical protein